MSKTITATAILQQVEQGKLRLMDPVVKYLPDFPYPTITIRHLLSHTSGLPPYNAFFDSVQTAHPDSVFTNVDFIQGVNANKRPLLYQPGEKWNYDNVNFIVLALILEQVSGTPFNVYIEKHILRPAGMSNTTFFPLSLQFDPSHVHSKNLATPHWYPHFYSDTPIRATAIPYVVTYWHAYNFIGFGDYTSTTEDLLKYDEALYDGRLLGKAELQEAFTPVKLNDGKDNPGLYALGWEVEKDSSLGKVVYHGGNSIGLSCILVRNLTKHQTVIVFDIAHDDAHSIANSVLKILNGKRVQSPRNNLAKLYGRVLVTRGAAVARDTLMMLKSDTVNYELSEDDFNTLGYDFLGNTNPFHMPVEHKYAQALIVFETNIALFPRSWNVYDSYGEALLKSGRKPEAVAMYQKSIELSWQ
jgi:tetratricopeptide (TPR) repeat protein